MKIMIKDVKEIKTESGAISKSKSLSSGTKEQSGQKQQSTASPEASELKVNTDNEEYMKTTMENIKKTSTAKEEY